jgi:molybdenum cofactor cytidylyltransferase
MRMRVIGAVILAAGASSRYRAADDDSTQNKLLLPFAGELVLTRAIRNIHAGGLMHTCLVTGHDADAIRRTVRDLPVTCIHNPDYATGEMISSIQCGLRHWQAFPEIDAALIALGDMPLLPASIVARLITAYQRGCGDILAPRIRAQRGHPVLIARRFWDAALALSPGTPMRQLLADNRDAVGLLQVSDSAVLSDVDTPALYREALNTQATTSAGRR